MKAVRIHIVLICCMMIPKAYSTPTADFTYTGNCQGQPIQFTNNSTPLSGQIILHVWDFGDGSTSNAVSPVHQFDFAGFFTVTLTVLDSNGDFDVFTEVVQIDSSPVAAFSVEETPTCERESIQFTNNSVDFLSAEWDFGDGSFANTTDAFHEYSAAGNYTVSLTVSNSNCSSAIEKQIEIAPKPQPTFEVQNTCENEVLKIENTTSESGDRYDYRWFVDNEIQTLDKSPEILTDSGNRTLRLEVTSDVGCTDYFEENVTVFSVENAQFDVGDVCIDEQVLLQPTVLNIITSEWKLNNQAPVIAEEFSFSAQSPGINSITRTTTDTNGCKDTSARSFTVWANPEPSFDLDDHCFGTLVSPTNESSILTGTLSYKWDIEGQIFSDNEPQFVFASPGTKTISVEAESDRGCRATLVKEVNVVERPQAGTISGNQNFCEGLSEQVVLTLDNHQGEIERWEKQEEGRSYWEVISHSGENLLVTSMDKSTSYRAVVANATCGEVVTNAFQVTYRPSLTAGEIVGASKICESEEEMQLTYAGSTVESIIWEAFMNGQWIMIESAKSVIQSDLSFSERQFRVIVSDGICQRDTTSIFTANVTPSPAKPRVLGESVFCQDEDKKLRAENTENISYVWQKSADGVGNWIDVAPKQEYLELDDKVDTAVFRIKVVDPVCGAIYSDPKQVTVIAASRAGLIDGPGQVCRGESLDLRLSDYQGDSISWFRTSDRFSFDAESEALSVRPDRSESYQAIVSNEFCAPDTTQRFTVIVNNPPDPQIEVIGSCSGEEILMYDSNSSGIENRSWSVLGETIDQDSIKRSFAAGQYEVSLSVINQWGCSKERKSQFTINSSPEADFELSTVCSDEKVELIDLSSSGQRNWHLNGEVFFPDTLSFLDSGLYEVSLVVQSQAGCSDSSTQLLRVSPVPQISLESNDVCLGETLAAEAFADLDDVSLSWQIDGVEIDGEKRISFIPAEEGRYEIKVRGISREGCEANESIEAQVFTSPYVDFSINHQCEGDTLLLQNVITHAEETDFRWFEADVSIGQGDQLSMVRMPGNYKISLEAVTEAGCRNRKDSIIGIFERPDVDFEFEGLCADETFEFSVIDEDEGTSYAWKIDDQQTSGGSTLRRNFTEPGDYSVSLIGVSSQGCESETKRLIQVEPVPYFSLAGEDHCYGSEVTFVASPLSQTPASYRWLLDDGRTYNGNNLTTTFLNPGTQHLQVEAITDKGCSYSLIDSVTVFDAPIANFMIEDICPGERVSTTNSSFFTTGNAYYSWEINGSAVGTGFVLDTLLVSEGTYQVQLSITDDNGCSDKLTREFQVYPLPSIQVRDSLISVSKGYPVTLSAEGASTYLWQPAAGVENVFSASTLATPLESTLFEVIGTNEYGCEDRAFVKVNVTDDLRLVPSNVLTPDGNGQNDSWVIQNAEVYENVSVQVYDRQGRLVYGNSAYRNDWDGTFGNDLLPEGTYYYQVSHPGLTQTYQGALTILRSK